MGQNEILSILIIILAKIVIFNQTRRYIFFNSGEYRLLKEKINTFLCEIENNKKTYFTDSTKQRLLSEYVQYRKRLNKIIFNRKCDVKEIETFIDMFDNLDDKIKGWNKQYSELELDQNMELFNDINGKAADEEKYRL
ncbi:MAG: hypothetical protein WA131_01150 [Desulfitobacteriaceae bacterium]